MSVQRLVQQITIPWHCLLVCGSVVGVLGAALFFRLNSLLPGYSKAEISTYLASQNLGNLLENPFNAPFLVVERGVSYIFSGPLAGRVTATLFGAATLALFALLVRKWHDTRTTVIGTLLFGLSAWFLHTARMGTPEILLFGVFALTACGFWLKESRSWLTVVTGFLIVTMLLFVPGMIWFVLLGITWQWKVVDRAFKEHLLAVTLAGIAMLAALAPLAWAIYKDASLLKPFLGLPSDWPGITEILKNVIGVPFHFFVRAAENPAAWLGNAPIFDAFSLAMLALGGYLYLRHRKLARVPLFVGIFALTGGLVALGSAISFSIVIPFAYLVIAAGASRLLGQWFEVFPRNPIARTIGWALACVVIALVGIYHITHYFVGWPHATATHEIYTIQSDTIDQ